MENFDSFFYVLTDKVFITKVYGYLRTVSLVHRIPQDIM